jgi:uncharacterized protein
MLDQILHPWPWYIAGPLLGLFPALLLWVGNRLFGVSSNLRHMCAALLPGEKAYFQYDWRGEGAWNLVFGLGILIGGYLAGNVLANPDPVAISEAARESQSALGISDFTGLAPEELFNWANLATWRGILVMIGGGFLVGFGTAYAGGCTSGHGISGIADLQLPSLLALISFFVGGILGTYLLVPVLIGGLL